MFFVAVFPSNLVLILPMRNGNSIGVLFYLALGKGSYPTYEEWKLAI